MKKKQSDIKEIKLPKFSKEKRKRNMSLGIKEGGAANITTTIIDTYITPFALAIGANSAHIGFLNSFSGLLSPLSQLHGSKFLEKYTRKKLMVFSAAWQILMLLPIVLLGILFISDIKVGLPYFLIVFYSLYVILGALAGLSWFSLMGDIVPPEERGRYFGKRNAILLAIGIIVTLSAAFLLDFLKMQGKLLIGFSILFFMAILARGVSVLILRKYEDPDEKKKKLNAGFFHFLKSIHKTNYGKFVIYVAFLNFAAMIASPFFTVYILEELKLSYTWLTIINLAQSVSMVFFMLIWGKFADRYGNKKTLVIGSVLIPLLPLLWIFNQNPYYLLIPMFLGGIGWAAFNLASSNFVYDSIESEKRAAYLAYMNVVAGIGIFLGAGLGGIIIEYVSISFMNIFLFIFLVSAILRFLAGVIMMPLIKEVRRVKEFSFGDITPLLHLKTIGQHTNLHHHQGLHLKSFE